MIYFEHELIELIAEGAIEIWPSVVEESEGYIILFATDYRIEGDADSGVITYIEKDECRHMYE